MALTELPTIATFGGEKESGEQLTGAEFTALSEFSVTVGEEIGLGDASTPGSLREGIAHRARAVEYVVGIQGVHTGCDIYDSGNGAAIKAFLATLEPLAYRRRRVLFRNGTYVFSPGNGDITVGSEVDLVAESVGGVKLYAPSGTFANLNVFNGMLMAFSEGATANGITFITEGSIITSLTGTIPNNYLYSIRFRNRCKFTDCELIWIQYTGTYIPPRGLGDINPASTVEGIEFLRCKIRVTLQTPLTTGLYHFEMGQHTIDGLYVGSSVCTNFFRECEFYYTHAQAQIPETDATFDIFWKGGVSMYDCRTYGNFVLNTRAGPPSGSFSGMEIDGLYADMRGYSGTHFQISLIAGATDTECDWYGAAVRNVTIVRDPATAPSVFTGWIEIVAVYADTAGYLGTHIHDPVMENIRLEGENLVSRFDWVLASSAPGSLRNAAFRNISDNGVGNTKLLLGNHWTPTVGIVPPRVQTIDNVTLDNVLLDRLLVYQNIAGTSANITGLSLEGNTRLNYLDSETGMTIVDPIQLGDSVRVGSFNHVIAATRIQGIRRMIRAVAPTVTDDSAAGFRVDDEIRVGSVTWVCTDATPGAAVWIPFAIANGGNFTPALTALANVASVALQAVPHCVYTRVGQIAHVEMVLAITPSAAAVMYIQIESYSFPYPPKTEPIERAIGTVGTINYLAVPRGGVYVQSGTNAIRAVLDSTGGVTPFEIFLKFSYEIAAGY